ncbi:MAG: DNA mismatch repair endonuclease MutL [Promethearchaeati archaeon]
MNRRKIKPIKNADKIAAGEVVERPANVVKELIENSIDAEATEIRINIRKAGKVSIQVIDNGIGIPSDDLSVAFESHTSSKIRGIEDLEILSTLGFRGEALASIAAVSKIDIISRIEEEKFGKQLIIEGRKIVNEREISAPVGTNIRVSNLFYNTPARQKFLKTDSTELGHITDIIQRYALAYPHLHFIYTHNELTMINCPLQNDLQTTIFHIYGKKIAQLCESIHYEEKGYRFKLSGFLGHPKTAKKGRQYSTFFINKRFIKSSLLFDAVKEAYEGVLMIGRNPFFVLNLDLDPSVIDFNIHPKKLRVRFEDEEFVYNKVYNIIRDFVENKFIKDEGKYLSTNLQDFGSQKEFHQHETILEEELIEIEDITNNEHKLPSKDLTSIQLNLEDTQIFDSKNQKGDSYFRGKYINIKNFPKIRPISLTGQLSNNIYIILEGINENNEEGFFILDQHAASERINKEFLIQQYEQSNKHKQRLISPLKIELNPSEKLFLEDNLKEIKKLGFTFEPFRGNTFILREIPTVFQKEINPIIIKDIISDITEIGKDKSFSKVKEEIINYLACHRSIRGGDDLSLQAIQKLIIELAHCNDPFHCAHGRPTLKFFSFKELDKLFKRNG